MKTHRVPSSRWLEVALCFTLFTGLSAAPNTMPPLLLQRGTNWLSFPPTNSPACFVFSIEECPNNAFFPALDHSGDTNWYDRDGNLYTVQYVMYWTNLTSFGFPQDPYDLDFAHMANDLDLHVEFTTNSGTTWAPFWFKKQGWISTDAEGNESNYVEIVYNCFGESLGTNSGVWNDPNGVGIGVLSNTFWGVGSNQWFVFDRANTQTNRLFRLVMTSSESSFMANVLVLTNEASTNILGASGAPQNLVASPDPTPKSSVVSPMGALGVVLVVVVLVITISVLTWYGWKRWTAFEKIIQAKQKRERNEGDDDNNPPDDGTNQPPNSP